MNGFIQLKGDCPICIGARKDCRQSKKTGLIHCRHADANPLDHIFRGLDSLDFGMWSPKVDAEAYSEEKREEWRRQKEVERQQRLEAERNQRSQLLSEPNRDREIRKILGQLDLIPQHRENLRQRGLSDEQIEAGEFRSVKRFQKLNTEVSHRLAGVNIDGRSLTNWQPGMLCPTRNPEGQFTGWQLRLDNTSDEGKYRWATSANDDRPNAPTAHLPNGELPIHCARPSGELRTKEIGIVEGILKSQIAAELSGQIFVGAAGGNFASSRETTKAYLAQLESENEEAPFLVLYPDAGAIANPSVMRQYRKTQALMKELGYELNVSWWGQTTKEEHLDIDELLAAGRGDEIQTITWEQFEELEELAQNPNVIRDGFKGLFHNLKQKLDKAFKGFGKPPEKPETSSKEEQPKPKYIDYVPGQLPSLIDFYVEYKEGLRLRFSPSIVEYKKGERLKIWQEAVEKFKYILDVTQTGGGKSHDAGLVRPEDFDAKKILYFSTNHRNPTTAPVEANFKDLNVRNDGMAVDHSRRTALNKPHVIWPTKDNPASLPGNCHRQPIFAAYRAKNIKIEGVQSPICQTCHLFNACGNESGEGHGFRSERQNTFKSDRIRANPSSFPPPDESNDGSEDDPDKANDFNYSDSVSVWDEANISAMDSIAVKIADFEKVMGVLENELPTLHELLTPMRTRLRDILTGKIKAPYYGFDDAAIRDLLPALPKDLTEIIEQLYSVLRPDFSILNVTEKYGQDFKDLPDFMKKKCRGKQGKIVEKIEDSTPLNWLIPFLRVWSGARGALSYQYGNLTISENNDRHREIAKACKSSIFMNATLDREDLALLLDVDESEILVIREKVENHNNLQILQVTGMGRLGQDRSDSLITRVDALKVELETRYLGIEFLDWLAQSLRGEKSWFKDSQGSNAFQNCPAIASFGVPCQNLTALANLYMTLTGRRVRLDNQNRDRQKNQDPEFQAFVDRHTHAEIKQAIGRLRANRRPNEKLTFLFVADYDLDFLGMPVEKVEAFDISRLAGNALQQTRWAIFQAARKILEGGQKLTQVNLAAAAGITQSRVSQIFTELGCGWKCFKKILAALLKFLNSGTNISQDLTEDEIWLAQEYLPQLVKGDFDDGSSEVEMKDSPGSRVRQVVDVARSVGREKFEAILSVASLEFKSDLLALLVGILPVEVRQEFLSLPVFEWSDWLDLGCPDGGLDW